MVVDTFDGDSDPVQVFSDRARIKINQCEADDYIGCYYGDQQHYIGRVITKEAHQVQVSFTFVERIILFYSLGSILSKEASKK